MNQQKQIKRPDRHIAGQNKFNDLRLQSKNNKAVASILRPETVNVDNDMVADKKKVKTSVPYSNGQTMARYERRFFEDRFQQDFGHIEIHRDKQASQLTQALGTKAFAYGNHVFFNKNVYSPSTTEGRKIISHELAHTNQQAERGKNRIQCWPASIHQTITKSVIEKEFMGKLSADALLKLAFYSGQLDQRVCNYLVYLQDFVLPKAITDFKVEPYKIPIIGPILEYTLSGNSKIPLLSLPLNSAMSQHSKLPFMQKLLKNDLSFHPFKSYALSEYESPNHGEANQYKESNAIKTKKTGKDGKKEIKVSGGKRTKENETRMFKHLNKALSIVGQRGLTKQAMVYWGMALHVGQDRGSHEEGVWGMGHDRTKDEDGKKWNCDSPQENQSGYHVAKTHTKTLINKFIQSLSQSNKTNLQKVSFGDLAGTKEIFVDTTKNEAEKGPITENERMFAYLTLIKIMQIGKDGMPKRLFGMMPLLWKLSLNIQGSKKKLAKIEPQLGVRIFKPTPLTYLDLFAGPSVGFGLDEKRGEIGASVGAQFGKIGDHGDTNLMINHTWMTGGGSSTIVGITGTWDDYKILKFLGIR